jgi:hypothetical protein
MAGIVHVLGASGGTPALLDWMIRAMYPQYQAALPRPEQRASVNPLYPYYREYFGPLVPVPYVYLSALRRGLDAQFTPRGGSGIALAIGRHWWEGEPPIQQYRPTKATLQYLLAPSMLDALHEARIAYISQIRPHIPGQHHTPPEASEPLLLWAACHAFGAALLQQGGVSCQVARASHGADVVFPDCPFCEGQLLTCNLLRGVVEAMLLWTYRQPDLGTLRASPSGERIVVSLANDDSHRLQVYLE